MNVARLLVESAAAMPAAVAICDGADALMDYRTFALRVARLAGYLGANGIRPGDRVALFMTNEPAYLEALYSVLHRGAIAVPVNARLHERELAYILEASGARLCFCNADCATTAARAAGLVPVPPRLVETGSPGWHAAQGVAPLPLVHRDGDDVAWLFFTSGTTGRPKGAMLTHRNILLMSSSYLTEVDVVGPGDAILHAAPLSHGSGMYSFAHVARAAAQLLPQSRGFDTAEIAAIAARRSGISMFAAPTMLHRMLRALPDDDALSGFKLIVYGGGPMLVEQSLAAIDRLGPRLAQIYGQGECPMTITRLPRALHRRGGDEAVLRRRLASVGTPFNLVDVRIGDPRAPGAPGEAGEILVKSPIVMRGYWHQDDAPTSGDDGWLRTGDVGYFDDEGLLHLSDRSKDVIISGGSNIYSRELEDVLVRHPGVHEVAIIGRPSEDWGEEVVAVVGCGAGEPPPVAELDALCASELARFKRPRHYVFLPELPKNAYGKIEKRLLRERLAADLGRGSRDPSPQER
jgi:long-chain acyl-CoA synthetase